MKAEFQGGKDSYILRYDLPAMYSAAGVEIKLRLSGWKSLDYAAVGYRKTTDYQHIKAKNVRQDAFVELGFTHQDLIWKLQNGSQETAVVDFKEVRVFIKGEPLESGAVLEVAEVNLLPERVRLDSPPNTPLSQELLNVLYSYLKGSFRDYAHNASVIMESGSYPVPGKQELHWRIDAERPEGLEAVTTYRFTWHALHPAINLLLSARETGELGPVFAARNFIDNWLEQSFFSPDEDVKFAWYDHGTAERLLALILMWEKGVELVFDARFMSRLEVAIVEHARLLNSEAFYAHDQLLRYHNHAWFQDAALIVASLTFREHSEAKSWLENAISRFDDQLDKLIVRDEGFAIFVENSIGYHHGVQRLAEFVGQLVELTGEETEIPTIAQELVAWSDFFRYPDGRAPAQGDTFRLPPRTGKDVRRGKPWDKPGCTVLPRAGYAVVRGNHEGKPWMLCFFNTSLSNTHKHEDNCSITLWFDGVEWLLDPSFYSHEYDKSIPRYLRGSEAHNCLIMPKIAYLLGQESSTVGEFDNNQFKITATHRSYEGFCVRRTISGGYESLHMDVRDEVFPSSSCVEAQFYIGFHASEGVCFLKKDGGIKMTSADSSYHILISGDKEGGLDASVHKSLLGLGFMQSSESFSMRMTPTSKCESVWSISATR